MHYPVPLPKQEAFKKDINLDETFQVADELSQTVLSLPMHGLITKATVDIL